MQSAKSKKLNRLCCPLATPDIGFRKVGDDFPNTSNTFASSFENARSALLNKLSNVLRVAGKHRAFRLSSIRDYFRTMWKSDRYLRRQLTLCYISRHCASRQCIHFHYIYM